MDRSRFNAILQEKQVLILDGATGTNLQARGLKPGQVGEEWVLERPGEIARLNQDFLAAGSDILLTCTFGASRIRLKDAGLEDRFEEINRRAVEITHQACAEKGALVAGSLGPTGHMLAPYGPMSIPEAEESYREQARLLSAAGVDLLVIETQFDLAEAAAAVRGVRSACELPLVCSFSFDRGTRTMMGVRPRQLPQELAQGTDNLAVDAFGINCGRSLEDNLQALVELKQYTTLPIWFKPNAGLPGTDASGQAVYSITPEQMGMQVSSWLDAGARFIGGCCGTSPDHLRAISQAAARYQDGHPPT